LLIAGTNAGSTREVIQHTEAAKKLGYDTVLLAPPYYALPSPDELIAHYQSVLDAVDVEICLYNYPPRVGVEVGFETLDAFADNPRVIGIRKAVAAWCVPSRSTSAMANTSCPAAAMTRHWTSSCGVPAAGSAARPTS
jgi:dihydrodipicolinate synthase/N-acetylneuraminate lyase